ncbi:MAG: diacylglycerol kinase [Ahrensia sp.]
MKRLIAAWHNSMKGLKHLARHEAAIRLELVLLVLSVPAALLLTREITGLMLLIGAVVFLLLVEVLNSAIEAVCDAVTLEHNPHIAIAKDAGSLAVLLASAMCAAIWLHAVWKLPLGA